MVNQVIEVIVGIVGTISLVWLFKYIEQQDHEEAVKDATRRVPRKKPKKTETEEPRDARELMSALEQLGNMAAPTPVLCTDSTTNLGGYQPPHM
jgi:hypothetical protein